MFSNLLKILITLALSYLTLVGIPPGSTFVLTKLPRLNQYGPYLGVGVIKGKGHQIQGHSGLIRLVTALDVL